ncbi:MAG: hypothetical protein QF561_01835 [Phycisphaerales bacterium]|jgi:hypothetical protein|nr:hypothetical protein [Phycisphaerales bacterium]
MKLMNRDTYLSLMLTLTACLLTADLWTRAAANPPLMDAAAMAQAGKAPTRGAGSASTLAYEQRKEMIKVLKELSSEVTRLRGDLKAGAVSVSVKELPSK